ncbi:tetratricopeptide repeat protein [Profundibacterium mesophilum]|uniref:Localization factor PodJL n=1 Tax=Profundibacterium mesophilum KAUST100406-0324 TaxID=1037889 RepID=A0A921NXL7_9RHOB|nr:tetratricopeptide repeat protein [Profundibacterium mesophilum]KAF0677568.1 localization factor PodJL [Profundibacterium mesophilum KAUST100406-0324]
MGKLAGHPTIFVILAALASPAAADLEAARQAMEAGRFAEAHAGFQVAARSGNADAEELIGVMHAMGLGMPRDDIRAFDWYMRAALKGHAGAQSGVGWYYEVGRGLPAPDMVRAYAWYTLSAIGGDPDAAISLEEITRRMPPGTIEQAMRLVEDYRPWLYPFR